MRDALRLVGHGAVAISAAAFIQTLAGKGEHRARRVRGPSMQICGRRQRCSRTNLEPFQPVQPNASHQKMPNRPYTRASCYAIRNANWSQILIKSPIREFTRTGHPSSPSATGLKAGPVLQLGQVLHHDGLFKRLLNQLGLVLQARQKSRSGHVALAERIRSRSSLPGR